MALRAGCSRTAWLRKARNCRRFAPAWLSPACRGPSVRDRLGNGGYRICFTSAILPFYARRSKSLEVLIPVPVPEWHLDWRLHRAPANTFPSVNRNAIARASRSRCGVSVDDLLLRQSRFPGGVVDQMLALVVGAYALLLPLDWRVCQDSNPRYWGDLGSRRTVYNEARTHLSLDKDAPVSRAVEAVGSIVAKPLPVGTALPPKEPWASMSSNGHW